MTPQGIDSGKPILSDKLGTGKYASEVEDPIVYHAGNNYYIDDISLKTSYHTSGETFLHALEMKWKELPYVNA